MVSTMTQMDPLPEDRLVVDAIQLKKDMFTSRFVKYNKPSQWDSMDTWYFNHVCTVLNHAKALFEADVDDLANKQVKIKEYQ